MRLHLCELTVTVAALSPLYALQPALLCGTSAPMHTRTGFVRSSARYHMPQHPSPNRFSPFIIEYLINEKNNLGNSHTISTSQIQL